MNVKRLKASIAAKGQIEPKTPTSLTPYRTCGTCRVCCSVPDIPEINKPLDEPCPKLEPDLRKPGCSIYGTRPEVCRDFRCAWLSGLGEARDRPDRSGVLWQPLEMPDGGPGLGIVEVQKGALDIPRNAAFVRDFERTKPGRIAVRRYREARFQVAEIRVNGRAIEAKPGAQKTAGAKRAG